MSSFLRRIKYLLVDLDGVLYRGSAPLPKATEFVRWLRSRSISPCFVTNNATLTRSAYVGKLGGMGIESSESEIFTSAVATGLYLKEEKSAGQTVFVIGEEGLLKAVEEAGLVLTAERPQWVVVGLDRQVTYDKLATAALCIRSGARFVASNPDTSFPSERGLVPGAGAIQAALVATTGVEPVVIGKPRPLMLELAMEKMGSTRENTAMLGDRLDTDIAAADVLKMPSILVLTGVSKREDADSGPTPGLIVGGLEELMTKWEDALA